MKRFLAILRRYVRIEIVIGLAITLVVLLVLAFEGR